ncbi:MAG: hypothetical protein GF334_03925 [Candidatus Altiarchaeales archaeon]|nr:hypothetical protein [Candidatus Altiarchaeales archaeon]
MIGKNEEIINLTEKLKKEYRRLNDERFDGLLPDYEVRFSMKAYRTHGSINFQRKRINISLPLLKQYGWESVNQTLLHEMTHLYIHLKGGRASHSKRFWREFQKRGGRRDKIKVDPVDCYVYACPTCGMEIKRLKKIKQPWRHSCLKCDRSYNPRHRIYLKRDKGQRGLN